MKRKLAPSRSAERFCIGPVCNESDDTIKNVVTVLAVVGALAVIHGILKKQ